MDRDTRHLLRAIYADHPDAEEVLDHCDPADVIAMAEVYLTGRRDMLYNLMAAAVGGGAPVDVLAYVREHHGGDWQRAVAFACNVIGQFQGHTRPSEARGVLPVQGR